MAEKTNNTTSAISHVNEITRISVGAEIVQGILVSVNDIRIDGKFNGNISSKGKVVVGEQSIVKGDICCQYIDIWGKVFGTITCGEVLTLMNTCDLKGNIKSQKISIENGAKFNGECKMINPEEFGKISSEFDKSISSHLQREESQDKKLNK